MEIVKGKRTKRHRPHSPTAAAAAYYSDEISVSTEEEEDMANCLILLAQGITRNQERENDDDIEEEEQSRREKVTDSFVTGRAGSYIFECKTCNRMFTSFQALGGHRASHKKPKLDPKEDNYVKREEVKGQSSNSLSLHAAAPDLIASSVAIKTSKVHECSICGSEFSSGQALGGHMRRHRVAPPVKAANESEDEVSDRKTINILSFDLNLPAPLDDDHAESTFGFRPKNHMVFAVPALVGCHY